MKQMHAGVLHGIQDMRYELVDCPSPTEDEVVVKVRAVGVCSSDIDRFLGRMIYKYPLIPGHEISGEISELGKNISNMSVGDPVVIYPLIPCRLCRPCRNKLYNLCNNYNYIGSRANGGFSEFVKCPVSNLMKLPHGINFDEAALIEPMAVSFHAFQRAKFQKGNALLVYGLGPIGLFTVQWGKILGASQIIAVDRHPSRLLMAKKYGATQIINNSTQSVVKEVMEATSNEGVDCIFECSGSSSLQEQALSTIKKAGTIVWVGNAKDDLLIHEEEMPKILRKEITILGSWNSILENDWKRCIAELASHKMDPKNLITHRFKLKDIKTVFIDIINKKIEPVKVVFVD